MNGIKNNFPIVKKEKNLKHCTGREKNSQFKQNAYQCILCKIKETCSSSEKTQNIHRNFYWKTVWKETLAIPKNIRGDRIKNSLMKIIHEDSYFVEIEQDWVQCFVFVIRVGDRYIFLADFELYVKTWCKLDLWPCSSELRRVK